MVALRDRHWRFRIGAGLFCIGVAEFEIVEDLQGWTKLLLRKIKRDVQEHPKRYDADVEELLGGGFETGNGKNDFAAESDDMCHRSDNGPRHRLRKRGVASASPGGRMHACRFE
jgi:hypothetical protein